MSIPPTLLLADDSVTIQRMVSLTFSDQPVRLVVARDGQDAINRMATDRPDLVLADTNMPCIDGYEVARWVRQQPHLSAIPVLLLAGMNDPVDEQRLHDSGANGVLEKPFEPSHVISRVKELLGIRGTSSPAATRLVTSPDAKPIRRILPKSTEPDPPGPGVSAVSPRVDAVAPGLPSGQSPEGGASSRALAGFAADAGETVSNGVAVADRESAAPPMDGELAERESAAAAPPAGTDMHDLSFYGHPEAPPSNGLHADFVAETADEFESLLAAEQGAAAEPTRALSAPVMAAAPEVTDLMLDVLATRVVQRLRPSAIRDELQRELGSGLRETVAQTLHDTVALETRAAVAEAVQAAVDGSLLGTVRGAVNEAVSQAVDSALRRMLPAAVEQVVREAVSAQLASVVREAVERELRDTVAPLMERAVHDLVGTAVQLAVAESVPAAVQEAVRSEISDHLRETVTQTSERMVRDEIARIRERRG